MTGKHILDLMLQEGYSVNKMAELIGTSQPNLLSALKHTDVRTGLLEKIAQAMGKPLAFFYGEEYGVVSRVTGSSNATAINHSTATSSDDRLIDLLRTKDDQLTMAMNQTSKAQAQTDKAQEQMDRILDKYLGRSEEI
jgi:hypothetical protein